MRDMMIFFCICRMISAYLYVSTILSTQPYIFFIMKTILIIEKDIAELDTLLGIFQEWNTEFNILTARDEFNALSILKNHQIEIILCATSILCRDGKNLLASITELYPFIPCIGLLGSKEPNNNQLLAKGAVYLHHKPYNSAQLFEHITELLILSDGSTIRDIPTHSLLQMLETEENTSTVKIYGKSETGYIFIEAGIPMASETDQLKGQDAFFEIIGWDDVIIEVLHFNGQRERNLDRPLIALIMEGFKLKDENDSQDIVTTTSNHNERPLLKKVSTVGQRLSLDIGSRIKLEFNQIEGTFNTTMIGMSPNSYLVTTFPTQLVSKKDAPSIGSHVLAKFLHIGKLCIFKSIIVATTRQPQDLLFLDYPSVIHYHEMRQTKRTCIFIPCTLNLSEGGEFFGALIDMSSSGGLCEIKIKGNQHLPPTSLQSQIELRCLLPGMKEEQQIHGIIKNMTQNSTETRFGIEFINIHSFLIETINKYLFSIEQLEE